MDVVYGNFNALFSHKKHIRWEEMLLERKKDFTVVCVNVSAIVVSCRLWYVHSTGHTARKHVCHFQNYGDLFVIWSFLSFSSFACFFFFFPKAFAVYSSGNKSYTTRALCDFYTDTINSRCSKNVCLVWHWDFLSDFQLHPLNECRWQPFTPKHLKH